MMVNNDRTLTPPPVGGKSGSPPTARVVAVLQRLSDSPGLSASQLARDVGANRSTITAVLQELVAAGWVHREPGPTFRLGPGLSRLRPPVRTDEELTSSAREALSTLTARTGAGAALVRVDGVELEFAVVAGATPHQVPPGVEAGIRLPMRPPAGASFIAHRPSEEQRAWTLALPEHERPSMRAFMDTIRARGAGVWRLEGDHVRVFDILAEVTRKLGHEHRQLRARALSELFTLSRRGYRAEELDSGSSLSVSQIVVPLVGPRGHSGYEIDLGILRPNVTPKELDEYLRLLHGAAAQLTPLLPEAAHS